jgi:hypothetical protein
MSEAARGGQLRAVWVPQPEDDAIRDLAQARNDVLLGQLALRQANGTLSPADLLQINSLWAP